MTPVVDASARDVEFTDYLAARQGAMLRTAYLICGDQHQAEDVLQTALAKLYLAWDKVHDKHAVDAYLRRIIANEATSLWRRAWHRKERATDDVPEGSPHHDRYDDGTDDELWALVQSLPRRARAVIVLRYYEQLSEAETADALGISVGTVKSQASRAMATLRERAPAHLHPRGGGHA
ncbi:SigE family RNA polymerase sigma factor [Nocardioides acrostichi]|uniref:SigE family RNA polymerase sigma factor n=1 Tax=Nocardioides acrostichi TaxID=2784339 RepID=A0A930USR1_9ACTN|nr:SigE family RNA polymerase sigma factor [Nocardioides acrostichi]MBF4160153.1 SigE family RNA polymerase sigma factor [Nocardioides acrostichi]